MDNLGTTRCTGITGKVVVYKDCFFLFYPKRWYVSNSYIDMIYSPQVNVCRKRLNHTNVSILKHSDMFCLRRMLYVETFASSVDNKLDILSLENSSNCYVISRLHFTVIVFYTYRGMP